MRTAHPQMYFEQKKRNYAQNIKLLDPHIHNEVHMNAVIATSFFYIIVSFLV